MGQDSRVEPEDNAFLRERVLTLERERAAVEERYRRITETVNHYVYRVRIEDGRAVETRHGEACVAVTGYTCEEFAADPWLWHRMVAENDRPAVEAQAQALLVGEGRAPLDHRIAHKDGRTRWVRNTPVLHRDPSGRLTGYDGVIQDVTEQKRAEQALRDSEERFSRVLEHYQDGIVVVDSRGQVHVWNRALERVTGTAAGNAVGRPFWDVWAEVAPLHKRDAETVLRTRKRIEDLLATGDAPWARRWVEREYDVPGMPRRVLEDFFLPMRSADGFELCVIVRDVSERKRAEQALRESEEMYRTLAETSPDMNFVVDGDGYVRYVNGVGARFLRATPATVVGRRLDELFEPRTAARHLDAVREVIRSAETVRRETLDPLAGEERWIDTHLSPVRDESGEVVAVQGVSRDVTERKHTEQNLAAERERLAVTLSSIADGVIATDIDGAVRIVNRVAEQLTGWPEVEAAGRSLDDVFRVLDPARGDPCPDLRQRLLAPGGGAVTLALGARDGAERSVAARGAPIRDAEGLVVGLVLAFHDVTEKEKVEQQLRQTQKLESIALLAGGIAHDFNNILTGILGNVSLARMLVAPESKAGQRLLEAERAAVRAQDLTQQLLTFSKGGTPIRRPRDLRPLVREAATFASRGSAVGVELSVAADLWPAEVDAGQFNQALGNLVLNAVQAMPLGGTVRVRAANLEPEAERPLSLAPGRYVRVEVEDAGVGIPEALLERIFDPFFTTKQRGNGLGLSMAYSIVKAHGGQVTVASRPGEGSTFRLFLPATERAVCEEHTARAPRPAPARVLVMDDEPMIRDLSSEILLSHGCSVECAREGAEAVDAYRRARDAGAPFDVVIMDLTVAGGLGGREAIARIRAIDPQVRAICTSGYSTDPVMARFREHGFDAVLVKPFGVESLLAALAAARQPG